MKNQAVLVLAAALTLVGLSACGARERPAAVPETATVEGKAVATAEPAVERANTDDDVVVGPFIAGNGASAVTYYYIVRD